MSRFTEWERGTEEEAQVPVDNVARELASGGVQVSSEIKRALAGRAARQFCYTADDRDADLIVMGSRGLTDLEGLVVGRVARKVLHLSTRPVLVAH